MKTPYETTMCECGEPKMKMHELCSLCRADRDWQMSLAKGIMEDDKELLERLAKE